MKKSDFYAICGVVLLAPHLNKWVALGMAIFWMWRLAVAMKDET